MRILPVVLLAVIGSAAAQAQPSCKLDSDLAGKQDPMSLELLDRLKGTVAFGGNNVCSGALATFKGRSGSARAYVLSAAHCVDRGRLQIPMRSGAAIAALDDGEVLYRADYRQPLTLDTGKSDEPRTCIEADQVVYGTLTGSDIMLLQLTETYEDIERRTGVKPFVVSQDALFTVGLAVRMPSSLWQTDRECLVEGTAEKVKEFKWIWGPVMRLRVDEDTCIAPAGVSGAPAIRKETGEVIGVFGTSGDIAGADCELNNPCEVKPDGSLVRAAKDQNYVHFAHQFYSCLDAARDVDLSTPGCSLPRPK